MHGLVYVYVWRHKYTYHTYMYECMHVCMHLSLWGGLWTIKSFFHALGIYLQMTESTTNSTVCIFIKQLSNSDVQKMVIQFTTWFTSNMVYTLNNKIKHSVH